MEYYLEGHSASPRVMIPAAVPSTNCTLMCPRLPVSPPSLIIRAVQVLSDLHEVIDEFFVVDVYVAYAGLRLPDLLMRASLAAKRRESMKPTWRIFEIGLFVALVCVI